MANLLSRSPMLHRSTTLNTNAEHTSRARARLELVGGAKNEDLHGSERHDATLNRQSYNHSTSLLGVGLERP